MGFLKKLFGGRTALERLAHAERLLREGEPGLARIELDAAIADQALPAPDRTRAEGLLVTARATLAHARLEAARSFLAAGDLAEATDALQAGAALSDTAALRDEIATLRADLDAARRRGGRTQAAGTAGGARARDREEVDSDEEDEEAGEDEEDDGDEGDAETHPDEREEPLAAEGDHEITPLELAFLGVPEDEGERLRALTAIDASLADALGLGATGDYAKAILRFHEVREPAASDPLVLREHAKALVLAGDAARAVELLERIVPQALDKLTGIPPPGDLASRELLVDARLAMGDERGATEAAQTLLAYTLPRGDLDGLVSLLGDPAEAARAIESIDKMLRTSPRNARLWEARGAILDRIGSEEDAVASDDRALKLFGSAPGSFFPLSSARRRAQALSREDRSAQDTARAKALIALLVEHDPEGRRRWRTLLRELSR